MSDTMHPDSLGPLATTMGMTVHAASAREAVVTMPVAPNTQPAGLLHGGASAALAETAGSLAAARHAPAGRVAVGVELSITHHRPAHTGNVTATARAVHLGTTLATYEIEIRDDQQRRVASARLTCMIISPS
ncbi:uncharacterized domain 1-containing protein [Micrococcales bacterium KH10]|nr:uncharacterized domain 1-containing protein [Micrococcales bacterium KH10]